MDANILISTSTSKIYGVLIEHVGLLSFLPRTVHLNSTLGTNWVFELGLICLGLGLGA